MAGLFVFVFVGALLLACAIWETRSRTRRKSWLRLYYKRRLVTCYDCDWFGEVGDDSLPITEDGFCAKCGTPIEIPNESPTP